MSTGHGDLTAARACAPARAAWPAWLGVGVLLAVAWVVAAVPGALSPPGGSPCLLRRVAGLACPTCGFTRALALLAQGAWRESLATHPWAAMLVAQGVAAWALWAAWLAGRLRARPDRWIPRAVALNLAALVVLWLARMLAGTLPG